MRVAADRWRSLNPDQHVNAFPEIGIRPMQGEDYGGSRRQLGGRQVYNVGSEAAATGAVLPPVTRLKKRRRAALRLDGGKIKLVPPATDRENGNLIHRAGLHTGATGRRSDMSSHPTAEPHIFVAFGATGDPIHRKLLPALHCLFTKGLLDERSVILGAAPPIDVNDESFRALARAPLGAAATDGFCGRRLYYQSIGEGTPADFQSLAARIAQLARDHHLPGNRVFYPALPPSAFAPTVERLGVAGLNRAPGWTRLVIEKPFGRDLESAQALNALIHRHFDEPQIYRIDHYVEKVEILVAETLGVEHRAAYCERADAVAPDSQTATFAALKLEIANYRWYGVPFFLHTGKRLPQRLSQIAVTFRHPPSRILEPLGCDSIHPNVLVIALQPNEGFDLQFEVKTPGRSVRLTTKRLHFRYAEAFDKLPSAYEALLLDVLIGDQSLFVRADWEEASWRLYTPLLERPFPVQTYPAGTWGPAASERLSWPPRNLAAHEPSVEGRTA